MGERGREGERLSERWMRNLVCMCVLVLVCVCVCVWRERERERETEGGTEGGRVKTR